MPRPKRIRIIQSQPKCLKFTSDLKSNNQTIMTLEEYEAIRLMDYKHLTHDEAATMMNISRTTVTEIYETARNKIAEALCEGNDLLISGGNYELKKTKLISKFPLKKEGKQMKIAVTYENGLVFGHFGHTEAFKIYNVEDHKVLSSEVVSTNGQGHGALAQFLVNQHVDLLICGGIGSGAINALGQVNIAVLPGVTGEADEAIKAYLNETLKYDLNAKCDHHDHHHEGECGCGEHHHDHNHECHCHHDK